MKASDKHLILIQLQYEGMLTNLVEQLKEYGKALRAVVGQAELKTFSEDTDFIALAKDAFMYKLKDLYEYNKTEFTDQYHIDSKLMDSLMDDVNSILKDKKL